MHLKGLDLQGFKSFPDKICIDFESGITAIVGPNGSGKSNIADAVRWVLGEMSTKTLRGTKMEDVVFDGTSDRKAMGFAEVSLTIDNSDSTLPLDFNEVTVTRRYYRSGESEYFINRNPVRLRDINELFMDTGLGRDGYSIIGQGRISEILSVKSEDRRQIFEEAAGISKYRYKKAEAQKKLANTDENLIRVNDIVAELSSRIKPLKEQSAKAKKYLLLSEEKKQLEINMWLCNIEKSKTEREKLTNLCEITKTDYKNNDEDLLAVERDIDSAFLLQKTKTVEIDNLRTKIAELENAISNSSSEVAVLLNDISHLEDRINKIKESRESEQLFFDDTDKKISDQQDLIAQVELGMSAIDEELISLQSERTEFEKTASENIVKTNEIRTLIEKETAGITELKIKQSSILTSIEEQKNQLQVLSGDKTSTFSKLEEAKNNKKDMEVKLLELEGKKSGLLNVISGYKLKNDSFAAKISQTNEELTELNQKIFEKENKKNLLSDMEKNYEGFPSSIKQLMTEAKRGALSGIIGTVSSQIKVENEYTLAIETALSGAISNVIVESDKSAKSAISYLKHNKLGRATFLPIETIKATAVQSKEFSNKKGFVGVASELCQCKYTDIIDFLLGRTIICDNIDNAAALARDKDYKFKIVTLDGQIVNQGGSLTGGSAVKGAGILSRNNEINVIVDELSTLNKKSQETSTTLKEITENSKELLAKIDAAWAELRVLEENIIRQTSSISHNEILISSLESSLENSQQLNTATLKKIEELVLQQTEIESLSSTKATIADELMLELSKLTDDAKNISEEKEVYTQKISDKQIQLMSIQKDKEAAVNIWNALNLEREIKKRSFSSLEAELLAIGEQITSKKLLVDKNNEITDSNKQAVIANKQFIESLVNEREKCEGEISNLRTRERELTSNKNKLAIEHERLNSKFESLQSEYDNLIAKLFDEYELTLTEAQTLRTPMESVTATAKKVSEIRSQIKGLGSVNVDSIEEYIEVSERYEFLSLQLEDLTKAKLELERIINDLTVNMKSIFEDQFKIINLNFSKTFSELFGGGSASLKLSDPSDILTSGIEISVAPPGKIIKQLSSLSGGEQAFVAIALYFAILKVRPTPFCILDEIEAALDDINVVRFAEYLRRLTSSTQFISITHRRGTMEEADRLYGVTMPEKGVSKILTINVNEIEKQIKL